MRVEGHVRIPLDRWVIVSRIERGATNDLISEWSVGPRITSSAGRWEEASLERQT